MEHLPQELVERICGYLTRDDLKNTLTLSQSFQHASERASGAYAQFDLSKENARQFQELYTGRRWAYLRHVRLQTAIPAYNEDEAEAADEEYLQNHHCRESNEEVRTKDEQFTEQIRFVFDTLKALEGNTCEGKLQLTIFAPIREVRSSCPHRKCISRRLHLLSAETLPKLGSVRALRIDDPEMIFPLEEDKSLLKIDLRVIVELAVRLPRLEYIGCKLNAGSSWTSYYSKEITQKYVGECDRPGPLRDARNDFARALESAQLPSTLRQAQLDFLWPLSSTERIIHDGPLPNLVRPKIHDPFSSSLRLLASRLRKLELKVVADASLLWPSDGTASYPNLESVCILFHMATPSGQWYFDGPQGQGHDAQGFEVNDRSYPPVEDTSDDEALDEEADDLGVNTEVITSKQFRVRPNDRALVPFLSSFAKAALEMPNLKEACLWSPLRWDSYDSLGDSAAAAGAEVAKDPGRPLAWGIAYIAPKTLGFHYEGQHYSESRQLFWMTGSWRPNDDVREIFSRIGNQDTELLEYYGLEACGGKDKLALRDVFDYFQIFDYRHPNCVWPVDKSFIVCKTVQ